MKRTAPRLAALGLLLVPVLALLLAACGGDDEPEAQPLNTPEVSGELLVFAASSLTDAFEDVGRAFENSHEGTSVRFNFAGSSALATQMEEGGQADVFASADTVLLERLRNGVHVGPPTVFATNVPVLVVPRGSNAVTSFEDLAKDGVRLVLAGPDVPIGRYARELLANASGPQGIAPDFSDRVLSNLRSEEANVRAVLAKVQLGEADAGIVYATDVAAAAGEVESIPIPDNFNVVAEYPAAIVVHAANKPLAAVFVEYLLSDEARQVLEKHGFKAK